MARESPIGTVFLLLDWTSRFIGTTFRDKALERLKLEREITVDGTAREVEHLRLYRKVE